MGFLNHSILESFYVLIVRSVQKSECMVGFFCICRSVCWENVIVRRVFLLFGGVLFLKRLIRVSVIFGGLFGGLYKPLQFGEFAMF